MTEPFNGPPLVMGVPDSTGMGGLPTLGSSLPAIVWPVSTDNMVYLSSLSSSLKLSHKWPA